MLREIIKPQTEEYILHIPKEYLNRDIEILVLPFSHSVKEEFADNNFYNKVQKTAGLLKNKLPDPVQWQKDMRSEWDREE